MKFAACRSILNRTIITLVVNLALGLIAASAFAQSEVFIFDPGGKATLRNLVQSDPHDKCVVYSMNIPLTFESTGNILDNLVEGGPNEFAEVFVGEAGQLCDQGNSIFGARYPESSLQLSKTKLTESIHYSSRATCDGSFNPVPVGLGLRHPILFRLSVKRANGKGSLALKGVVPDLQYPFSTPGRTIIHHEIDVMLVLGAIDGSDSNSGVACVTVPLKALK